MRVHSVRFGRWCRLWLGLLGACLVAAGCSDGNGGNGGADGDGGLGGDAGPSTTDGGTAGGEDSSQPIPAPSAPTISAPAAAAEVFAEVAVAGEGEPGATLRARILRTGEELGGATGVVTQDGSIDLRVTYAGAEDGQDLLLEVVQTNAGGDSPATTVSLVHRAPFTLSGTVKQTSGDMQGTVVVVRLYASAEVEGAAQPIDEAQLTAQAGQTLEASAFSFDVAAGTYYLRAFRDATGPGDASPDGEPTYPTDPQAPLSDPIEVTNGATSGHTLKLVAATAQSGQYDAFDVRAENESAVAEPPTAYVNDTELVGEGLCRGFYLHLSAQRQRSASDLSAPHVLTPGGEVVTLLDDGGCGEAVRDNTSSSYDYSADDGQFSLGIADPASGDAGDYKFFYVNTEDNFLHVEVDSVAAITKLPLLRKVTAPIGVSAETQPQISWEPVPGAAAYRVDIFPMSGGQGNADDDNRDVDTTSYQPEATYALADDACYHLSIRAFDSLEGDTDASSGGSSHAFCVDTQGDSTVQVSGALTNRTGEQGDYVIELSSGDDRRVRARIAADSANYSLEVLASSQSDGGRLWAFIDLAGTGDDRSPANMGLSTGVDNLDLTSDATGVDLSFNAPVILVSPQEGTTASDLTPSFGWQDYATSAGSAAPSGPFSYALFIADQSSEGEDADMPQTIIGLPSTTTSVDLGALPSNAVDLVAIAQCLGANATPEADASGTITCSGDGGTTTPEGSVMPLEAGKLYEWGIAVVACDHADWSPPNISDFVTCAAPLLQGEAEPYAMGTRTLRTP